MERRSTPNPASEAPRARWLCAWQLACAASWVACGGKAPELSPAHTAASEARAPQTSADGAADAGSGAPAPEGDETACPRLPRVSRLWTGFAAEVPNSAPLHLTLDAVVPIQRALGAIFCGPEREACRPQALRGIELTDEHAGAARVELVIDASAPERPGLLTLRQVAEDSWQADPDSLAAFLAACRARGAQPAAAP